MGNIIRIACYKILVSATKSRKSRQSCSLDEQVKEINWRLRKSALKRKRLCNLDLFVLDNSLRETVAGQSRGHDLAHKWKIYNEVSLCSFKHVIVASFSNTTRLGEEFILDLAKKGADMSCVYVLVELISEIQNESPNTLCIPSGFLKMKELNIKNPVIEVDLAYERIDYTMFTDRVICDTLSNRFAWVRQNLVANAKIFVNFRDFPDAMLQRPDSVLAIVQHLSSLPPSARPFGILFEDYGLYLPRELATWTRAVRDIMNKYEWTDGHLLVHVHERWGMKDASQLECLASGANGIWAALCDEGPGLGHASSTVTIMNLVRLGNKKVLRTFNCNALCRGAEIVSEVTSGCKMRHNQVLCGHTQSRYCF